MFLYQILASTMHGKILKIEIRNSRVTKSSYEIHLRNMASHFELLTRKVL